ncbi:hypothetical protein [Anabaena sp. UHCC 0204]|uniref:hypothetical protein n=1 Tax=Anabaena sp. UHCC 0204 TaxID=2590009 RepID=UPI001446F2CE|nr:hypothetical protein [Anabaena sp. UHCC 0204]MTJ09149.1 hypothetical protein [Anabaena sp. UHCC 0204]
MTISIDPITHKKLILVKQIYQNAIVQSASSHSTISRIMAVIGFDLAVETILRAIIGSLDAMKSPADGFQALIQQADSLLKKEGYSSIPDKSNIQYLHSIRNDAQHKAKYPNESDVSDCRTYTRDFLRKVNREVWAIDFDTISLTDIIENQEIQKYLVTAELNLKQDNYQEAVRNSSSGLTLALKRVENAIVGSLPSVTDGIVLIDQFGKQASQSNCKQAYRAFEKMQDILLYVALGMNYSDYMRYKQIVGDVYFTFSGTTLYPNMKVDINASDAEFVVAYCVDTVVQIENIVGSIDAPFGKKSWF